MLVAGALPCQRTMNIDQGRRDRCLKRTRYVDKALAHYYSSHPPRSEPFLHGESCVRGRLNLVIRPNVLRGGSAYTFRLSAVDTGSLKTGERWYLSSQEIQCQVHMPQPITPPRLGGSL